MDSFAINLKRERQKKNLSQEELGNLIGVTGVTIMRYEKGAREPKIETIKSIANALKIPVANLIDLNSPIITKATRRFVSGKYPEEIETYGDVVDDIVMNSPFGEKINEYQAAIAGLNQTQFELITMCYQSLDNNGKKKLCEYACQLLENTDDYKQAIEEYGEEIFSDEPPTTE